MGKAAVDRLPRRPVRCRHGIARRRNCQTTTETASSKSTSTPTALATSTSIRTAGCTFPTAVCTTWTRTPLTAPRATSGPMDWRTGTNPWGRTAPNHRLLVRLRRERNIGLRRNRIVLRRLRRVPIHWIRRRRQPVRILGHHGELLHCAELPPPVLGAFHRWRMMEPTKPVIDSGRRFRRLRSDIRIHRTGRRQRPVGDRLPARLRTRTSRTWTRTSGHRRHRAPAPRRRLGRLRHVGVRRLGGHAEPIDLTTHVVPEPGRRPGGIGHQPSGCAPD